MPVPVRNEHGVEQPDPERPRDRLRLIVGTDAEVDALAASGGGNDMPRANRCCDTVFAAPMPSPSPLPSSSGSAADCLRIRLGLPSIGGTASASSASGRVLSLLVSRERSIRREKYSGESFGTRVGEAIAA